MVCESTEHSDINFLVEEQDYLGLEEGICLFFQQLFSPYLFAYKQKTFFAKRIISLFCHCLCFSSNFLLFIPETLTKQREYMDLKH